MGLVSLQLPILTHGGFLLYPSPNLPIPTEVSISIPVTLSTLIPATTSIQSVVQRMEFGFATSQAKIFCKFPIPKFDRCWEDIQLRHSQLSGGECKGPVKSELVALTASSRNQILSEISKSTSCET